jgi:hypothetical protein
MPFPAASLLLVAYMAWPNNEAERNGWMATSTASFAARQVESTRAESPTKQVTFELFGGFRVIADSSFSYMMEKLTAVQQRWSRVADVLQAVIDIKHEMRRPIRGGASISKAYDLLKGYPALPRKSQLSKDWSDFRDVAHLIAAAAAIASRGRDRAEGASAVLTAVMLVPEVVLALALAYQRFGLTFRPHGRGVPILPPETLWRVPDVEDAPVLPLLIRRLSAPDLEYLTNKRRALKRRLAISTS